MKEKTKNGWAQILTALLVLAVAVGFMPQTGMTAYAANGDPAMNSGTDALDQNVNTSDAETVYYADKTWRVIGYDGEDGGAASKSGAITLLAAENLEQTPFDESSPYSNVYAESTLKTKVDAIAESFSAGEQGSIVKKTLVKGDYNGSDTDCIAGEEDIADVLLWPLSTKEANAVNNDLRIVDPEHTGWATSYWWLRSPGDYDYSTAVVYGDGYVRDGIDVYWTYGVRPAFDLNLESVLFTSAAESGKSSGAEGADALTEVSANSTNEWKLTLLDDGTITGLDGHKDFAIKPAGITADAAAGTVTVPYSGATTGTNEYISAIIKDSNDNIKYYGRIAKASDAEDAAVTISTANIEEGATLCVFNEQYNGDKTSDLSPQTDYSSALQEVTIPISYTVTFTDGQGKTLKTQKVESGKAATAPPDPKRTGYTFTGWDKDFSKVTANMTVTAKWKKDPAPVTKVSGTLMAKVTAKGSKSLVISWSKVTGADGYDIFFSMCNHHGKEMKLKKVRTVKGNKTFKWTKKSLKKKTAYKAVIKAYVMKNGKKSYVRTSPMTHAYTSGWTKNYTNPKSVTVKKTSISLKTGKTYKIKASVKKLKKGRKLMPSGHAPKLRYLSSNKKIATVSSSGKITAKSKGNCKIYVYAVNGVYKSVAVAVK